MHIHDLGKWENVLLNQQHANAVGVVHTALQGSLRAHVTREQNEVGEKREEGELSQADFCLYHIKQRNHQGSRIRMRDERMRVYVYACACIFA